MGWGVCVWKKEGGGGVNAESMCEEYINVILKRDWLSKFWNFTIII